MKKKHTAKARDKPRVSFREIADYCSLYCIRPANSYNSFYFWHNGTKYRISDHSPSVAWLEDNVYLIQVEQPMKDLVEIHQAIINGYEIDHEGRVKRSAA